MIRRSITALCVLALTAFAGTAWAASPPSVAGSADTSADIGSLTVPGVGEGTLSLGWARSFATTDPDAQRNPLGSGKPYAIAGVMAGDREYSTSSREGGVVEGQSVELPGVGTLHLGQMVAESTETSAYSSVEMVGADIALPVLGVLAELTDVASTVDERAAVSSSTMRIGGISIGLTDLLPVDVLAALSLDQLISLLDALGVDLPLGDLDAALDEVRELIATVGAVDALESQVQAARTARDGLLDQRPSLVTAVSGAEAGLAAVNAGITSLQAESDALAAEIATVCVVPGLPLCAELQGALGDVQAQLSGAQAQLSAAQGTVDATKAALAELDALIDEAEGALRDLVAQLDDLIDQLIDLARLVESLDLAGLLQALIDGLAGVELLGVDELTIATASEAGHDERASSATCELGGVRALGVAYAPGTCADLGAVFAGVQAALQGVIEQLPIVGAIPTDVVTVSGPTATASDAEVDGVQYARAAVSALGVEVKALRLSQVADGLVATLTELVDGTLAELGSLTGIDLPVDATEVLQDLLSTLDSLPLDDLLGGLELPGTALSLGGMTSVADFGVKAAGDTPTPMDPAAPSTPADPAPGSGPLPTTGGGAVVVALALLAAAGATMLLGRPRQGSAG